MRRLLLCAIACTVLLSGCAALDRSPSSDDPSSTVDVRVDGNLPADVDASAVYERVQRLLDVEAREPVTVRVRPPPDPSDSGTAGESFLEYLGAADDVDRRPRAVAKSGTVVVVYETGDWTADELESVLAHEFVHTLQEQRGVDGRLGSARATSMPDRAVIEGAATFAQQAYERRHLDVEPRDDGRFNESAPNRKLNFAQYILGVRYVDARIDDPADLDRIYENPPETTEHLLHGLEPGSERPRVLSVDVDTADYVAETRGTRGELEVNAVLSVELDDERAWTAASGWGADELVRFQLLPGPEEEGYAWTIRFDDPSEADEFRAAMAAFLDDRADRLEAATMDRRWRGPAHEYRVEPVGADTVVLFAGTDGFVDRATATGTADAVTVSMAAE